MQAQAKDRLSEPLGLYIHVPFCATTCDFCAFYQKRPQKGEMDAYISGIEQELDLYPEEDLERIRTIFWGGGTPGLLSPKDLERLGQAVLKRTGNNWTEWSVEMAPITAHPERLKILKNLGVTRISMGVQSFNDDLLDALGRTHPRKQIFEAWDHLKNSGFENINLDLIFAVPGQTDEALIQDLKQATELGPQHISTYCLTFEEDTKMWVKLSRGEIKPDPEAEEHQYRIAWETLETAGYLQYEISNFAQPGYACQHNVNTWRMHEWIGIGPSAASQYRGQRYTNPRSLQSWNLGLKEGTLPSQRIDQVILSDSIIIADRLGFGLRMNEGIALDTRLLSSSELTLTKLPIWAWLQNLCTEGLAELVENRLKLSLDGRLVADAIAAEILERLETVCRP
ncbi:MAG: radical SAM family heme chaperone HemW [Verrucomicrobiota bacterium]